MDISNCIRGLPLDIQNKIEEFVYVERQPKEILTDELKEDIESFAYFDDLLNLYKIYTSCLIHRLNLCQSDVLYLEFAENDFLSVLNDSVAILEVIQPDLQKVFPTKTHREICHEISKNHSEYSDCMRVLQKYWRFLTPSKRMLLRSEVYQNICNM